ncbi:uncharacterized protein SCHCODRAFT_02699752 [Schizophyllum commune H4-8]|nr:uncharacterized protein SCHCODRAFT_02706749 [Schizophyllum commune H4-8]XP_003036365.1 uncharacterized protein SCHCODRAFT_02699752 [Schizophyllum commune H4-8]KAI5885724.1 hypothetical protein SCHCODRAFT_02706749 [Schizophyllum commune H4-8]KAI5893021.1 hypothetical protein SCHCODRAFT_02699752 [Schizophyllum commune H4-8]
MQPSRKGKKVTARITPGRGPPPYRITRRSLGARRKPEEDAGEHICAPPGRRDETNDEADAGQTTVHNKHLRDVEHANRILERTKSNYASHIADLKTDLVATKALNRELIKQVRELQMSLRRIEEVVKDAFDKNDVQESTY